jgi:hypothetical protein
LAFVFWKCAKKLPQKVEKGEKKRRKSAKKVKMFHDINAEMHLSDKVLAQPGFVVTEPVDVVKLNLLHENQLLRERNNQLTQLNNNLMIEISQLKLEIDMMELKKGWNFDDRWVQLSSAALETFTLSPSLHNSPMEGWLNQPKHTKNALLSLGAIKS